MPTIGNVRIRAFTSNYAFAVQISNMSDPEDLSELGEEPEQRLFRRRKATASVGTDLFTHHEPKDII